MRNNIAFYIPIYYTLSTRVIGLKRFSSWLVIYVIPVLFIFTLYNNTDFSSGIAISLLSIALIYNNYELGYIYNDAERIKKEKNPTIRLKECNLTHYEQNKFKILIYRLVISVLLSLIIYSTHGGVSFILAVWLILFVYCLYNLTFSRWNLFLHFILVFLRYCSIAFLFADFSFNLIFLLLLFPIPNTLERATEKKFGMNISNLLKDIDKFRFHYYLALFFIVSISYFFGVERFNKYMLIYSFYYLFYRSSIYFLKLRT